jgi:hypothetical protein
MLTWKVGVGVPCYGFDDRTTGWKALNATICISMKGGCACFSLLAIIYIKIYCNSYSSRTAYM